MAEPTKEELEEIERWAEEESDYMWQMQQAEDAMWRDAVLAHI